MPHHSFREDDFPNIKFKPPQCNLRPLSLALLPVKWLQVVICNQLLSFLKDYKEHRNHPTQALTKMC